MEHARGQGDDDPTCGTIDTERFRLWAVEFLIPYLGDYSKGEARSIVIMAMLLSTGILKI